MLIPLSWLVEVVPGLASEPVDEISRRLTQAGLAVEHVEVLGQGFSGVLTGRVLEIEELTGFKKPIRFCQVDVGTGVRGIVCGARNFAVGDVVAAAVPGAVLPGDFRIAARETYGRTSDGMLCSTRELQLGEDHDGILILPADTPLGVDLSSLVGDTVLDVNITPDRGYCLSLRGIGREAATAFGLPYDDPAAVGAPEVVDGWPVRLEDPAGCDRYTAQLLTGVDPAATTPLALQRRLAAAGLRPISAAVDITNLVMLGVGQPLHAFDADKVAGAIVVRRATAGERLTTLDGVERTLSEQDLVIADDSGPVALAGVMGGLATEITASTTRVLLESAHFDAATTTRTVRRHKLPSEAARRFERGVDPALAPLASQVAVALFAELTGAKPEGFTDVDLRAPGVTLALPLGAPAAKAGRAYTPEVVRQRLLDVGCSVEGSDPLHVTPPSWRPDLTGEAELVEEVVRLEGYSTVPSVLPRVAAGRGLTREQRIRRSVGRALAHAGWVEAVTIPFLDGADLDALGLPADDDRRNATVIANPLADDAALMRTTLLPGLLRSLARNDGRGLRDVGLYETGLVFRPGPDPRPVAPVPGTDGPPTDAELAALEAALPHQPRRIGLVAAGQRVRPGWLGGGSAVTWADAIESAQVIARAVGLELTVAADQHAPWHPGRCAVLTALGPDGALVVGHAGELHPKVSESFGVPAGTVAMEVDLDRMLLAADPSPVRVPVVSPYPPISRDVALVVPATVPAATVQAALVDGGGALLESVRLFDRYAGDQVGAGLVSLAFRLLVRAVDRTLTDAEANDVRDAAVAAALAVSGGALRT